MPKACKTCSLMSLTKFFSSSHVSASVVLQKCKCFTFKNCCLYLCFLSLFFGSFLMFQVSFSPFQSSSTFIFISFLMFSSILGRIFHILCTTVCKVHFYFIVWLETWTKYKKKVVLPSSIREPVA